MRRATNQRTSAWRGYGDETEIGKWVRGNAHIPSRGKDSAFVVCNTDLTIHAYMQAIDGLGSRCVQSMIRVEWKSYGKEPDRWQLDTLFKEHSGINRCARGYKVANQTIINHGIYLCICSGATPEVSEKISWGRFKSDGGVDWKIVTIRQLNDILSFDIHPKTLSRQWLRRHHKTSEVCVVESHPLGFSVERTLTKRS